MSERQQLVHCMPGTNLSRHDGALYFCPDWRGGQNHKKALKMKLPCALVVVPICWVSSTQQSKKHAAEYTNFASLLSQEVEACLACFVIIREIGEWGVCLMLTASLPSYPKLAHLDYLRWNQKTWQVANNPQQDICPVTLHCNFRTPPDSRPCSLSPSNFSRRAGPRSS